VFRSACKRLADSLCEWNLAPTRIRGKKIHHTTEETLAFNGANPNFYLDLVSQLGFGNCAVARVLESR